MVMRPMISGGPVTYFLETRSRCSTKMGRISDKDGDILKIPKATNSIRGHWSGSHATNYIGRSREILMETRSSNHPPRWQNKHNACTTNGSRNTTAQKTAHTNTKQQDASTTTASDQTVCAGSARTRWGQTPNYSRSNFYLPESITDENFTRKSCSACLKCVVLYVPPTRHKCLPPTYIVIILCFEEI